MIKGLTPTRLALCAVEHPMIVAEGRFVSVGIGLTLLCFAGIDGDNLRPIPVSFGKQMTIRVNVTLRLTAARRMKCFEEACEQAFAPDWPTGCVVTRGDAARPD
jgi:hypothetical protein